MSVIPQQRALRARGPSKSPFAPQLCELGGSLSGPPSTMRDPCGMGTSVVGRRTQLVPSSRPGIRVVPEDGMPTGSLLCWTSPPQAAFQVPCSQAFLLAESTLIDSPSLTLQALA